MKNIVIDGDRFSDLEGFYKEILKKCHPTAREMVEKKLQDSKNGKGKTILDKIIDIIQDTDNTGHWCELEIEE